VIEGAKAFTLATEVVVASILLVLVVVVVRVLGSTQLKIEINSSKV